MSTNSTSRQLLELLSRRSGLNILVSPKVGGTITANFEGTTVDAVLKAVIKLANLVEKTEGPIHYLYTQGELDEDAEFLKREKIITRVYKLNYVRSDELLTMIRPFLSEEVGRKRVSVTPSYRFGIGESATFVSGGAAGGVGGRRRWRRRHFKHRRPDQSGCVGRRFHARADTSLRPAATRIQTTIS